MINDSSRIDSQLLSVVEEIPIPFDREKRVTTCTSLPPESFIKLSA